MAFGATGTGTTDDSNAFINTWKAACGAVSSSPVILIPQGKTFLLKPIWFQGPCKSPIQVQVKGKLLALPNLGSWKGLDIHEWLAFSQVQGLIIDGQGQGQIDGQGYNWWKACSNALRISNCVNVRLSGLKHFNSQRNHISIDGCNDVIVSGLHIFAPEQSPNTDGIDIAGSTNIQVMNSVIQTGDDCIAINTLCSNINITGVTCGPGHGISVGSLGMNGEVAKVEGIYVQNCTFTGSTNGARIKTWQGGAGYARHIIFDDITLINTDNPIIIDQYYCPNCVNQTSAVQISDVSYSRIRGTSATPTAISLMCSQTQGCTDIRLMHIKITSAHSSEPTSSKCINAHGKYTDSIPKVDCLLP
ncbi:unnamed protein product [Linum tenue]|uniref:Polygalacturonase n=3 Tax=Linum tenue TaxID=586396 RepID=A0AAV0P3P9_9ROSI|nr:unnamed protein product [Linum tenue]